MVNKVFSKITLFLVLSVFLFISFQAQAETTWMSSIKKGFDLAKSKNKNIVVDLYADWCNYCKTLKKEIYPREDITRELEHFITVRLNGEEFPNMMDRYNANGYPTILILDKNGSLLEKITGLPTVSMILNKLKSTKNRDMEGSLLAEWDKDQKGVMVNYKIGVYYYYAGILEKAEKYFKFAIQSDKSEAPEKRHDSHYNLCIVYMDKEIFPSSIQCWTEYITKYPAGKGDQATAHYFRGLAYKNINDKENAKKDLKKALELFTSPEEKKNISKMLESL